MAPWGKTRCCWRWSWVPCSGCCPWRGPWRGPWSCPISEQAGDAAHVLLGGPPDPPCAPRVVTAAPMLSRGATSNRRVAALGGAQGVHVAKITGCRALTS